MPFARVSVDRLIVAGMGETIGLHVPKLLQIAACRACHDAQASGWPVAEKRRRLLPEATRWLALAVERTSG